jgi:hypothetical protein
LLADDPAAADLVWRWPADNRHLYDGLMVAASGTVRAPCQRRGCDIRAGPPVAWTASWEVNHSRSISSQSVQSAAVVGGASRSSTKVAPGFAKTAAQSPVLARQHPRSKRRRGRFRTSIRTKGKPMTVETRDSCANV